MTIDRPILPVTLRRLEVFLSVVDAKGFSAAADLLGISQPSVSVHIRMLEKRIGSSLFARRNGGSPVLTEAGRRFCEYARDAVQRAADLTADLDQQNRERRLRLRCAAQRSVAYSILPHALTAFSAAFPSIEIITLTGTFAEVCELYHNRAVDLMLVLSPGEVAGMRTEFIGRCRLAFVASPKHELARMKSIAPETLSQHRYVSAHPQSYLGRTIADLLRRAGIGELNVAAQMQEMGLVRELVVANVGFSCCLLLNVTQDIAAGDMVELDVNLPPMYLDLRLARHKANGSQIDKFVAVVHKLELRT